MFSSGNILFIFFIYIVYNPNFEFTTTCLYRVQIVVCEGYVPILDEIHEYILISSFSVLAYIEKRLGCFSSIFQYKSFSSILKFSQ